MVFVTFQYIFLGSKEMSLCVIRLNVCACRLSFSIQTDGDNNFVMGSQSLVEEMMNLGYGGFHLFLISGFNLEYY